MTKLRNLEGILPQVLIPDIANQCFLVCNVEIEIGNLFIGVATIKDAYKEFSHTLTGAHGFVCLFVFWILFCFCEPVSLIGVTYRSIAKGILLGKEMTQR